MDHQKQVSGATLEHFFSNEPRCAEHRKNQRDASRIHVPRLQRMRFDAKMKFDLLAVIIRRDERSETKYSFDGTRRAFTMSQSCGRIARAGETERSPDDGLLLIRPVIYGKVSIEEGIIIEKAVWRVIGKAEERGSTRAESARETTIHDPAGRSSDPR